MPRLLVAEDDDAARALLQRYLEGKGYDVVAVADGKAALDAIHDGYDLVLLDVMMPHLTGFEVLEQTRARGDTTPIIMATAAASVDDVVRALERGADDYVTKPFAFPILLARIEARLRTRPTPAPLPPPLPDATFDASDAVVDENDAPFDSREGLAVPDETGILARIRRVAARMKSGARPPAPAGLTPGMTLAGRYVVGERIGVGGFGVVHRARHVDLGQDVAVKVLHPGMKGGVTAFRREAQNACRVRHHNAVRVFDFGVLDNGTAYLVMELLEGPTLEQKLVEAKELSLEHAIAVSRGVLAALGAAHRQAIVHRDVKPQNVVLHTEDGRESPKLLDFGIATVVDDVGDVELVGSAAYIAPERLQGRPYDGRADVYAFGVMLYRMLTGAFPFVHPLDDFEALAVWHVKGDLTPASRRNPDLVPGIDKVVARLLAKDPAQRPDAEAAAALVEGLMWE